MGGPQVSGLNSFAIFRPAVHVPPSKILTRGNDSSVAPTFSRNKFPTSSCVQKKKRSSQPNGFFLKQRAHSLSILDDDEI